MKRTSDLLLVTKTRNRPHMLCHNYDRCVTGRKGNIRVYLSEFLWPRGNQRPHNWLLFLSGQYTSTTGQLAWTSKWPTKKTYQVSLVCLHVGQPNQRQALGPERVAFTWDPESCYAKYCQRSNHQSRKDHISSSPHQTGADEAVCQNTEYWRWMFST